MLAVRARRARLRPGHPAPGPAAAERPQRRRPRHGRPAGRTGPSRAPTANVVYAAVPYQAQVQIAGVARDVLQVVVLTRQPPTGLASAGPWFLLSALVILIVAVVVADRLGRRFVRPIEAAAAGHRPHRRRRPRRPGARAARHGPRAGRARPRPSTPWPTSLARARGRSGSSCCRSPTTCARPLTSIRGFAEAIEDGATDDTHRAAAVIASEARRLERLVQDLLALAQLRRPPLLAATSRRSTWPRWPRRAPAGLPARGRRARPGPAGAARPREPIAGGADPDRLAQVVANLVENALKYARADVQVGVAVVRGASRSCGSTTTAPGIAPEDLPRVFERLFVSRQRPGRQLGTGLGLAIVAELVAAMGGQVRAESPTAADGGTRMVVTLRPAAPPT